LNLFEDITGVWFLNVLD